MPTVILVGLIALVLLVITFPVLRALLFGGRPIAASALAQDLTRRVVIVTGANDGVGKATVEVLANMGCTVVLGCRSRDKAQAAIKDLLSRSDRIDEKQLHFIALDLADLSSVRAFAEQFSARFSRLDTLINNAGVVTAAGVTDDGVETVFQVNHLGHFLLVHLLLDPIVAYHARIINVASHGHRLCRGTDVFDNVTHEITGAKARIFPYARSKLANILFTRVLQRRLRAAFPD